MTDTHPKITDREGFLYEIGAPTNMSMSLMEVMRAYGIAQNDEIGVCGGMAMCASCRCYMQNGEAVTLPGMGEEEQAMLSEAFHVKPNS